MDRIQSNGQEGGQPQVASLEPEPDVNLDNWGVKTDRKPSG